MIIITSIMKANIHKHTKTFTSMYFTRESDFSTVMYTEIHQINIETIVCTYVTQMNLS